MPAAIEPNPAKIEEQAGKIFGYLGGTMVSLSIYLGDQLGLYRAMAGAGPLTSAEAAQRAGLHERWVREWLSHQAAAGIIEYVDGRFELSPESALILADESTPASGIGMFGFLPSAMAIAQDLPECFRTGLGRKYDAHGSQMAAAMQRATASTMNVFTDAAIPSLDGMVAKLESGAKVADIGCGAGGRLLALAEKYSNSQFHGYDISEVALTLAGQNKTASGLSNVHFHHAERDPLPSDASFDLVTFGDVVHDLAKPARVLSGARKALKPDGTMLVIDIAAPDTLEECIAHPMATMLFGFSQLICMSSSLSEEGGAGIGTMGLTQALLKSLTDEAGFTRFRMTDVEDVMNNYYEIRP